MCYEIGHGFLPFTLLYHISFADVIGFRICNSCKKLLNSILSIFDTVYPFFALTLTQHSVRLDTFSVFYSSSLTQSIVDWVSLSSAHSLFILCICVCIPFSLMQNNYSCKHEILPRTHKMVQCSIDCSK